MMDIGRMIRNMVSELKRYKERLILDNSKKVSRMEKESKGRIMEYRLKDFSKMKFMMDREY